jgi:hypothetical protein
MKFERITDPDRIDPIKVDSLIAEGFHIIVQYSSPIYDQSTLDAINAIARKHTHNLEIRFYGHYSSGFDASVLKFIPEVRHLSIDCLHKVTNLVKLSHLKKLRELSLGVYELEENDILSLESLWSLESLRLGDTRNSRIDLSHLSGYTGLKHLCTSGHTKNIQSISSLPQLQKLTLASIKKKDEISFVSNIQNLTNLTISLGGRISISEIQAPSLTDLNIIRVRGLEELGDLGRFPNLERFWMEDQIKVNQVRFRNNASLNEIKIFNCKTLRGICGLETLCSLEHLRIIQTAIDYREFINTEFPSTLTCFAFYTNKVRVDDEISKDLESRGYSLS